MTVLDRPHRPAHKAAPHASHRAGTLGLLRLYLRRDRIVAPLLLDSSSGWACTAINRSSLTRAYLIASLVSDSVGGFQQFR
jgi:putative exporter of polyketide antibiotics